MNWLPWAALLAGALPLIFMSVGYYFIVARRERRRSEEDGRPPGSAAPRSGTAR